MNTILSQSMVFLFLGFMTTQVHAYDLKMTLKTHAAEIEFGAPLYVEVTVENIGKEKVTAYYPSLELNSMGFVVNSQTLDVQVELNERHGGFYGLGQVEYLPGKPVKYYYCVFLPDVQRRDNFFWQTYRGGGTVRISCRYTIAKMIDLKSYGGVKVKIKPQRQGMGDEMKRWDHKAYAYFRGPDLSFFGYHFQTCFTPEELQKMEKVFRIYEMDELAEIIHLTLAFKALYPSHPVTADDHAEVALLNEGIISIIRDQKSAIKQNYYFLVLKKIAATYDLESTHTALLKLEKELKQKVPQAKTQEENEVLPPFEDFKTNPFPAK